MTSCSPGRTSLHGRCHAGNTVDVPEVAADVVAGRMKSGRSVWPDIRRDGKVDGIAVVRMSANRDIAPQAGDVE